MYFASSRSERLPLTAVLRSFSEAIACPRRRPSRRLLRQRQLRGVPCSSSGQDILGRAPSPRVPTSNAGARRIHRAQTPQGWNAMLPAARISFVAFLVALVVAVVAFAPVFAAPPCATQST